MKFQDILLISDMDGTLLGKDFQIPQRNLEAVHRFMEEGGNFAIATGRSITSGAQYYEQIYPNAPCILLNGGILYDFRSGKTLRKHVLPKTAAEYLKELEKAFPDCGVEVYTEKTIVILQDDPYVEAHIRHENLPRVLLSAEEVTEPWCKMLFAGPPERMVQMATYCESHPLDGARFVRSADIYLEMLPDGVTKASCMEELLDVTHFRRENVYAIGDYYNDRELICAAGVSAVPENAPDELKALADLTVCHCYEGAVADFISWIENRLRG